DAAERELRPVPEVEFHGVPWGTYKAIARALIAEARGQRELAVHLAAGVALSPEVPITVVLAAQLFERAGLHERTVEALTLLPETVAPYVRATALVTRALMAPSVGPRGDAHAALEFALDLAVPQGVAKPFELTDDRLAALLHAHASWGTRHEAFV